MGTFFTFTEKPFITYLRPCDLQYEKVFFFKIGNVEQQLLLFIQLIPISKML